MFAETLWLIGIITNWTIALLCYLHQVLATDLEYSGKFPEPGKLWEFCSTAGKNYCDTRYSFRGARML